MADEDSKTLTVDDLLQQVVKLAGVGPEPDVQVGDKCLWFDLAIERLKPSPFNGKYTIVALHHDADSVRLYEAASAADPGEKLPPARLVTLSKTAKTMFAEVMNLERLVDMLAEELSMLTDDCGPAERERERILAYLGEMHPGTTVRTVAEHIAEEKHLEEDDDEPEPTEGPNGEHAPPPPPPGGP